MNDTLLQQPVCIGPAALRGEMEVPGGARSLVMFAHGSGSSAGSPRSRFVAGVLQRHGLATLRFDLLGPEEGPNRRKVFDIALLSERVEQALDWADAQPSWAGLRAGLFGDSTGAAAALCAAASRPGRVGAVVLLGGRPDLAAHCLPRIGAATLLIVGGADREVLELNRQALRQLHCSKRLELVPGAGHLFEDPGALGSVAELAADWFAHHLPAAPARLMG